MSSHNEPYDPYIPSGGAAPHGSSSQPANNNRTAALQAVRTQPPFKLILFATA
jgi:hypothetical protein